MPESSTATRVSFGLFEADLQTGELWKAGRRIKIQSQPFKVLAVLLERAGEVVSREELQLRLWGKDTIVDFDHSLGTAVNKIREALGDSADNPLFIETLARRGYRFIAPITYITSGPPVFSVAPSGAVSNGASGSSSTLSPEDGSPLDFSVAASPVSLLLSPGDSPPTSASAVRLLLQRPLFWLCTLTLLLLASIAGYDLGSARPRNTPPQVIQITDNGRISPGAPSMESLPAAVTDGVRLFASVIENGRSVLSQVDINTGEVQPLVIPSEIAAPSLGDISADGSRLLLRSHLSPESEQALWIVPTSGGSALRVSSILAHDATWMPDGHTILYAAGNQLFTIGDRDQTPHLYATDLPGRAFWLRWSPDGKLLRFTLIDPIAHTLSLWQLRTEKTRAEPILSHWTQPANECCGVWTPDGKSYIFQSSHGGNANLWQLSGGNTSTPSRITNGPLSFQAPVAARNSNRIFFLGLDSRAELYRFDEHDKEFIPDRTFLTGASRVTFSRNNSMVAWTDNIGRLWRAKRDGRERIQVTPDSMQVFLANWSPDGTQLALMAREPGTAWQIYLIGADGGNPKRLLQESRNAADPTWSADGKYLAYGRVTDLMGKEEGTRSISILNLSTGKSEILPGSEGLFSPRWSPDGRYIAAISLDQKRLMLCNLATHEWKMLAQTTVADPVWAADSKSIFLHAAFADTEPIYRISISDGRLEMIANLAAFRAGDTADYYFSGITPENVPLVRARTSTGNLYSLTLKAE